MNVTINIKLHQRQAQIFCDEKHDEVIALCGRKFGKTYGINYRALRGYQHERRLAYVAPEYSYIREWWDQYYAQYAPIITTNNKTEHKIIYNNGAELLMFTLDNMNAMRPYEFDEVIVDEAAMSPYLEQALTAVIPSTLMIRRGRLFIISTKNAREIGGRYLAHRARQASTNPRVAVYNFSSYSNPLTPLEWLENYKATVSSAIFREEILAEDVTTHGARIQRDWIEPFVKHKIDVDNYKYILGVDPAISELETADYTAAVILAAPNDKTLPRVVVDAQHIRIGQLNRVVAWIVALATKWSVKKISCEQVGFSQHLVDALRQAMPHVQHMPAKPTKSKLVRFLPLEGQIEHGHVKFADDLSRDFVDELLSFTGDKDEHDDFVDAFVHAENAATTNTAGVFVI